MSRQLGAREGSCELLDSLEASTEDLQLEDVAVAVDSHDTR
jgi:hypothetical protein